MRLGSGGSIFTFWLTLSVHTASVDVKCYTTVETTNNFS
jgi:hypothetical protein